MTKNQTIRRHHIYRVATGAGILLALLVVYRIYNVQDQSQFDRLRAIKLREVWLFWRDAGNQLSLINSARNNQDWPLLGCFTKADSPPRIGWRARSIQHLASIDCTGSLASCCDQVRFAGDRSFVCRNEMMFSNLGQLDHQSVFGELPSFFIVGAFVPCSSEERWIDVDDGLLERTLQVHMADSRIVVLFANGNVATCRRDVLLERWRGLLDIESSRGLEERTLVEGGFVFLTR